MKWIIHQLRKPRAEKVAIEDLDKLDASLRDIGSKLVDLKPKKKTDPVSIAALIVTMAALGLTYWSNHEDGVSRNEIQATTNWQNFLSLAVRNPNDANGFDSVRGYTKTFNLANSPIRL